MLSDKGYAIQGGVKNFLGETEEVTAPKFWQSSENSPPTELSYITDAEKNLLLQANLHGSLVNNQPNIGASGILSFDGFGSTDPGQNRAGGDVSGAMDRGQDDSGQQSSGGGSTSAFQGTQSNQYNTAMSEERQQQVVAKNIVDLVDQGVNVNDAISGKTPLERVLQSKSPFLTANVLNEILSPFANAANKSRRTSWLEGEDQFGMPRSRDFYIAYGRAFNPNATLVEGTPEYDFLTDSGYFESLGNDNLNQGGDGGNNVTAFDVPEDVKTVETNQNSMVNQYFNNMQSQSMSDVQKAYDQAKANLNMILTPTNQQFGYSAPISGGFTMANLSNNPYNIDYMKNRGLI
tara:strand:- start:302 stop:1345 length:1044 start_codon:yes stop_codon:yes gene_type:complete